MDRTKTLSRDEALGIVREYKRVISPRYKVEPKVIMYGSYAKGYALYPNQKLQTHGSSGPISAEMFVR